MDEIDAQLREFQPFRRLAPSTELQLVDASTAVFSGICSDESVGRDQHVVITQGIQYQDFLNAGGPILFAHDESQPNIGGATRIDTHGDVCRIFWRFVPREISRFAGMIQDLVAGKWLRTLSMSWRPIDGIKSRDPDRPKGIDFFKVDMLECSIVPIPALPSALIDARSHGVDTKPLYEWAEKLLDTGGLIVVPRDELETLRRAAKMPAQTKRASESADWKVGASKDLPIEDSDSWDGSAAEKSIFEWAGGDEFDSSKARKGFLVYDSANADKRGSYKLPIAHAVDGELKVPKGAIRAAASRLPQTDVPDDVKKRAESVLDHYRKKAGIGDESDKEERTLNPKLKRALERAPKVPTFRRGLYDVAQLCYCLQQLGYYHACAEDEAEFEGDESEVPGMLGEALVALGEALKAMAEEEIAELLAMHDDESAEEITETERALTTKDRAFIAGGKTPQTRAWRLGFAVARAGKALSKSNQEKLNDAQDHHERAMGHHKALGEHHAAVGEHMDEAVDHHERATDTLAQIGEHLRAIQDPTEASDADSHIDKAVSYHRAATGHLEKLGTAQADMADRHEDVGDSHRALGRCVRSAQRCVRSVVSGAVSTEADEPEADGLEKKEAAKAERARKDREARAARAREIAKQHREPITLD